MSETTRFRAVILWEEELRIASKALHNLYAFIENPEHDTEDIRERVWDTLELSAAALWGANDDNVPILVSRAGALLTRLQARRKRTEPPSPEPLP